jgi:hypothetical protein
VFFLLHKENFTDYFLLVKTSVSRPLEDSLETRSKRGEKRVFLSAPVEHKKVAPRGARGSILWPCPGSGAKTILFFFLAPAFAPCLEGRFGQGVRSPFSLPPDMLV